MMVSSASTKFELDQSTKNGDLLLHRNHWKHTHIHTHIHTHTDRHTD